MSVLFMADVPLADPTSGSEQVLKQQATGLAQQGMEVFAITRQASPPPWIIRKVAGVQEGCYRASAEDMIPSFSAMVKYPSRFYRQFSRYVGFQVAIAHQPFNCLSLLAMRKLRKIPLLYVFHSPSHEEYLLQHEDRRSLRNLAQAKIRQSVEKFCIKRAIKVMVLSYYMKEKVQDIHGIPANRIVVNPGGVDLNLFRPAKDRPLLKSNLGFPGGKIHLLTVRNLEPRMGLDNLLKCTYILKRKQAQVHLILGGEGGEKQNLENLIREYGLIDEVTMTGFIPSEKLPLYYGAADFFILPTRHLEGFGLVTPESMACGTPVLGTPVGGTKEILSNFNPQFLFRDASPEAMAQGIELAIGKYLSQEKQYGDLRIRCREYAENNYSWKLHLDQLKSILDEIMSSKELVA